MMIVPFEPVHLEDIDLDPSQRAIASLATDAEVAYWSGKAITVIDENEPVAVFGIIPENGIATVWAFIGEKLRAKPMALHRRAKRNLPIFMKHLGLKAVEARAFGRRDLAWLRRLGFEGDGARLRLVT